MPRAKKPVDPAAPPMKFRRKAAPEVVLDREGDALAAQPFSEPDAGDRIDPGSTAGKILAEIRSSDQAAPTKKLTGTRRSESRAAIEDLDGATLPTTTVASLIKIGPASIAISDCSTFETYEEFLARKALLDVATGICDVPLLAPILKEHQRLLTSWALRRGRAAIFAATGLGKGWMILEWARVVAAHTGMPVLILAPLAVSQQFQREARLLWGDGDWIKIAATQSAVGEPGVYVTNYQKLHHFDVTKFGGVAIDESSILKSLDGHYRRTLIEACRDVPFRLSATATPSPNDFTELGGQAEFLGVMTQQEMLATFFVHDGGSTADWRLKGHAVESFWKWVCSWGAMVTMPSDIGCSDDGYILPPLEYHDHIVPADPSDAAREGVLFSEAARTLNEQRAARRSSLGARVAIAGEIAKSYPDDQIICWCDLNDESDALAKAIPAAVEVRGSQSDDEKEGYIAAFIAGAAKVIVSKPSMLGFGLNLQCAPIQIFCGVTHSFEAQFQALRRSWRFGQKRQVHAHIISSEREGNVIANLRAKQLMADEMAREAQRHVSAFVRESIASVTRDTLAYEPTKNIVWPAWLKSEVRA